MTVKSLVIQKSCDLMTSIGYTFSVPRAVQVSIGFHINEQSKKNCYNILNNIRIPVDSDLLRFQNSLIGYVTPENYDSVVMAVTKKREGNVNLIKL